MSDHPVAFSGRKYADAPYPHFHIEDAVHPQSEAQIINWLERDAPWHLTRAAFYEQYEFSVRDCTLPDRLSYLNSRPFLDYIKRCFTESFSEEFEDRVDVTAHRLTAGQVIKIHNDYIPGGETHRLLIQLNRCWEPAQGGLLVLFRDQTKEGAAKFIIPKSRSAFGFAISVRSLHAVTKINSGDRYTLVYSLYAKR